MYNYVQCMLLYSTVQQSEIVYNILEHSAATVGVLQGTIVSSVPYYTVLYN